MAETLSCNYYIWNSLYVKGLRTREEIELAFSKGILTLYERNKILQR